MQGEADDRRVWDKVLGIAVNTIFAVGILVYVAFYTNSFNPFQKIVVLLVALILYTAARAFIRIAFRRRRSLGSRSFPNLLSGIDQTLAYLKTPNCDYKPDGC